MTRLKYLFITLLILGTMAFLFGCKPSTAENPDATTSLEEYQKELEEDSNRMSSYMNQANEIRESIEESQGHPMFNSNGD